MNFWLKSTQKKLLPLSFEQKFQLKSSQHDEAPGRRKKVIATYLIAFKNL